VEASSDAGADQQQRLQTVVSDRSGESASHCDEEAESTPQARSTEHPEGVESDDLEGMVSRPKSTGSVNEQVLVEMLDEDGEIEAVGDVEQIDVDDIPSEIRPIVETLAAKLDSQDGMDGGASRLIDL